MRWRRGELKVPEEPFCILSARDVSPGPLLVDEVQNPRRQVARSDRQQPRRANVLAQHDVGGEPLCCPNKV